MSRVRDGLAIRNLHSILGEGSVGALADAALLERFATRSGDEAEFAFSVLVERHGPAVLRVCRSILFDIHDAEDAFQATFLVLVRKADKVRVRDSVGPWLVGVAYRIASSARSASARRIVIEREGARPESATAGEPEREDLGRAVREEIDRVPELYRRPILLCYLGGLTHEAAARQIGCPVGTVRSRLAVGRQRLRDRLTRRGLAPAIALAAISSVNSARGGVAVRLVTSTTQSAMRLASGTAGTFSAVVATHVGTSARAMIMKKFKWVVASALAGTIVVSGGIGLGQQQKDPAPPQAENATRAAPKQEPTAPSVAARRASGLEMLLRAAKKQEELGNHDRALELTGQLEEAARGWGAELRRKAAAQRPVRKGGADVGLADPRKNEPRPSSDLQTFIALAAARRKGEPPVSAEDWQALADRRRSRFQGQKLLGRDEQTKAIQNQLEKRLSITFPADTPFEDVVRFFRENTQDEKADMPKGIPIYIDPVALEKAGATLMRELKVIIDVDNAPLKDALRLVLDQLGLVYIVKDGLLTITSGSL